VSLFDDDPKSEVSPRMNDRLRSDITLMIEAYGYDLVAELVSAHAPVQHVRLSQVDAPPTARRAGEEHESSDPSKFKATGIKGRILIWADRQPDEFDREDAVEWWLSTQQPDADRSRCETVRRRFDELVTISAFAETDLTGEIRKVRITPVGRGFVTNLHTIGKSKS
jgi:hypothetical protein